MKLIVQFPGCVKRFPLCVFALCMSLSYMVSHESELRETESRMTESLNWIRSLKQLGLLCGLARFFGLIAPSGGWRLLSRFGVEMFPVVMTVPLLPSVSLLSLLPANSFWNPLMSSFMASLILGDRGLGSSFLSLSSGGECWTGIVLLSGGYCLDFQGY